MWKALFLKIWSSSPMFTSPNNCCCVKSLWVCSCVCFQWIAQQECDYSTAEHTPTNFDHKTQSCSSGPQPGGVLVRSTTCATRQSPTPEIFKNMLCCYVQQQLIMIYPPKISAGCRPDARISRYLRGNISNRKNRIGVDLTFAFSDNLLLYSSFASVPFAVSEIEVKRKDFRQVLQQIKHSQDGLFSMKLCLPDDRLFDYC